MQKTVLVIRAVGAELAKRIYKPVAIIAGISLLFVITGMILLIIQSEWWLLLAIPVFLLSLVVMTVLLIAGVIIHTVNPAQKASQRKEVKSFVDKIQNLSEITQTPKPVLLFRVIRDIIFPREESFMKTTIGHTTSLKKEFDNLRRSFE